MLKQVIGNAQLFMVVKILQDVQETRCVGMNVVVRDPHLLIDDYPSDSLLPQLTLTGSVIETAIVDLPDDFEKAPECTYEFIPDEKSLDA